MQLNVPGLFPQGISQQLHFWMNGKPCPAPWDASFTANAEHQGNTSKAKNVDGDAALWAQYIPGEACAEAERSDSLNIESTTDELHDEALKEFIDVLVLQDDFQ